jgi:glutamate-5-semialdehyde dehydrogenase
VVAMIYEARPNVTVEASALTLKSGNAIVLRGGSEAIHTNRALAAVVSAALREAGLPVDAVQLIPFTDRDAVRALVQQADTVDLAIPRGGESLIRFVTEHARVPVVQHYKGVCHAFLDAGCDLERALAIVENAKLQRPGVCNALECLLVAESDAARLLPAIAARLASGGCELRGCERARAIVPDMTPATEADWGAEFLAKVLAVRVVDGLGERGERGALPPRGRRGVRGHQRVDALPRRRADGARRRDRHRDEPAALARTDGARVAHDHEVAARGRGPRPRLTPGELPSSITTRVHAHV